MTTSPLMSEPRTRTQRSFVKRIIDLWPYLFIAISVTGLSYIAATSR